jgi:hypothetical protein
VIDSYRLPNRGEMAEWLKAHAWKACIPQGIQGSNPCLSAIFLGHFASVTDHVQSEWSGAEWRWLDLWADLPGSR